MFGDLFNEVLQVTYDDCNQRLNAVEGWECIYDIHGEQRGQIQGIDVRPVDRVFRREVSRFNGTGPVVAAKREFER